jgi:uncharacterized phage protein (TIGR01671 family)
MQDRIIKFRAWNPIAKAMFETDGLDLKKQSLLRIDRNPWNVDVLGGWKKSDNYKLMQYTGLKDKNGKEIYEGDIVNLKRKLINKVGQIVYKNTGFYIKPFHDDYVLYDFDTEAVSVIGNIYENPELCESKQIEANKE